MVTEYGTLQGKQIYMGKITINVFLGVPFSRPLWVPSDLLPRSDQSPGKESEMPPPMPLRKNQRTVGWEVGCW